MLDGGTVAFVNTSANCRSELIHLVFTPVAFICCLVADTSIDVRFSERPKPSDSLFSKHVIQVVAICNRKCLREKSQYLIWPSEVDAFRLQEIGNKGTSEIQHIH